MIGQPASPFCLGVKCSQPPTSRLALRLSVFIRHMVIFIAI